MEEVAKKAYEKAMGALLGEFDAARRANGGEGADAKILAACEGIANLGVTFEAGINGVYNLFDTDGFHYCVFGGTKVLKTTEDNQVRGPFRIVKSVDVAAVPVVSAKTGLLYCAHKQNGDYQYVGLDWMTGELKERWIFPDDRRFWNAFGGITTILDNGDLLTGGAFGIKRVIAQ